MPYFPSPEQAAIAWLNSLNLSADGIATTLPADQTTWAEHGFIQVRAISGQGGLESVMPRSTMFQVDCWATNPNSGKPPWGKAAQIASEIWDACSDNSNQNKALTLPIANFHQVSIYTAYPQGEMRRFITAVESTTSTTRDPSSGYARYQFDLAIHWQVKKIVVP